IIDTAGRLHNNIHLMQELRKITKVIKKIDRFAPHEIMLIIDACNGQNSLKQMKNFHKYLNITGMIITKLDGTAKGGIIFSLANNFSIPIRYIGVGEKVHDLSKFHSKNFINAIFS
ncbi:MAG: signal recognition particle-docking protein FtsY, partial [Buchnera aphidicola]|nr:signal recognition particle-docking protein FtsY [Buchnera aphidicola]